MLGSPDLLTEMRRALLYLRNHPDKQRSLFGNIKNNKESISGDEAMTIAKGLISSESAERHRIVITYTTTDEGIAKLRDKLAELEGSKD